MAAKYDKTHPTGVAEVGGKGGATALRNQKAKAGVQMRLAGATWLEIAEALGYPTPRAALMAVERALAKQLDNTDREQLRQLAGHRLDRLLRATWPKAIDTEHPDQMLAVTKAREIVADHRKLFGLDAPTEVVVHSPTTQELEDWVSRVVSLQVPDVEEYNIFDVVEGEVVEDEDPPALAAGE